MAPRPSGVTVQWTDSAKNAHFRLAQNPCTTNASGSLLGRAGGQAPPQGTEDHGHGHREGASDQGYLTFR